MSRFRIFVFFYIITNAFACIIPEKLNAGANQESPYGSIILIEDHSEALSAVAKSGIKKAIVVHIDGHDDLWPPPSLSKIDYARKLASNRQFRDLREAGLYYVSQEKRSYNINNFLVMAYHLGLISEVYWAFPTLSEVDENVLKSVIASLLDRGPLSNPDDFKLTIQTPYIKGTISGVPVTIGSLRDIPTTEQPVWLDIDLDFFPPLYTTPVKSSYLGLFSAFFERLNKSELKAQISTVSYSHQGGYLDIRQRYLGQWLISLLEDPAKLEAAPPETWRLKEEALYQEYFHQDKAALDVYKQILEKEPRNADAHFSSSMLLFKNGQVEEGLRSLQEAYVIDNKYLLGYISAANLMLADKKSNDSEKVINKGLALQPRDPLLWDYLGNLHYNQGKYEEAAFNYNNVINNGGASPLTYSYLGDSFYRLNNFQAAAENYQAAIDLFKQNPATLLTAATWISLAKSYLTQNKRGAALRTFREYLEFFPDAPSSIKEEMQLLLDEKPST